LTLTRPEELSDETNDCTVWALATSAGLPYGVAHRYLADFGRKPRKGASFYTFLELRCNQVANYHFVRRDPPPAVNRYGHEIEPTLARVLPLCKHGRFVLRTNRHVFAVIDGVIHDGPNAANGARKRVSAVWELKAL